MSGHSDGRSGPQGSRGVSAAGRGLALEAEPRPVCAGTGPALLEGLGHVASPFKPAPPIMGESFKLLDVWVPRYKRKPARELENGCSYSHGLDFKF